MGCWRPQGLLSEGGDTGTAHAATALTGICNHVAGNGCVSAAMWRRIRRRCCSQICTNRRTTIPATWKRSTRVPTQSRPREFTPAAASSLERDWQLWSNWKGTSWQSAHSDRRGRNGRGTRPWWIRGRGQPQMSRSESGSSSGKGGRT